MRIYAFSFPHLWVHNTLLKFDEYGDGDGYGDSCVIDFAPEADLRCRAGVVVAAAIETATALIPKIDPH